MRLLVALTLAFGMAQAQMHFMEHIMKQRELPKPTPGNSERLSPTQWFTQKVDNFDDSNTNTFQTRYWWNDQYCDINNAANCPVFLMINGEFPAEPSYWLTAELQW